MNYLYGDSTESTLRSNFLELLRDAIDFAVFVLQADEGIKAGKAKIAQLSEEATAELARLDAFATGVSGAIDAGEKGEPGSPTALCAAQVADLLAGAQRATADAIRAKLAADIAAIEAEEAASRSACHDALFAFLNPHGADDAQTTRRLALLETGSYDATLAGQSSFGIDWLFELRIPEDNLWAQPVRLERIAPHIEISAPQVTGWISKEVKVKPQRLERHTATELTTNGTRTFVKLRVEAAVETGFDVEIDGGVVRATRIGAADDASIGPFELAEADAVTLADIVEKLTAAASQLRNARLIEANVDTTPFRAVPTFVPVVERLVAVLTPVVHEIAKRSLQPTELVLRRALADDRREEFFVTKSTLRDKYAVLPPPLRSLFAPLGFDAQHPPSQPPKISEQTSRTDVMRSAPPPPPPPSSQGGKNESFVEAVKKIMLVLRSGQTDEGYGQYADLLSSDGFAEYRPEDQRQALKLLLLAKAPESRSDAVLRAYRIALKRIQTLVDAHAEPADYEMLGVAHVQLEDRAAAMAAFDIALKLERARNPSSDLCASLGRRIGQLG